MRLLWYSSSPFRVRQADRDRAIQDEQRDEHGRRARAHRSNARQREQPFGFRQEEQRRRAGDSASSIVVIGMPAQNIITMKNTKNDIDVASRAH
jgi:hypothetical protein